MCVKQRRKKKHTRGDLLLIRGTKNNFRITCTSSSRAVTDSGTYRIQKYQGARRAQGSTDISPEVTAKTGMVCFQV